MKLRSPIGLLLAGIYVVISIYFIATQGLFGESFIAIILGMPWSMAFSYVEYWGATGTLLYVLILLPLAINTLLLYWIGSLIWKRKS